MYFLLTIYDNGVTLLHNFKILSLVGEKGRIRHNIVTIQYRPKVLAVASYGTCCA